MKKKPADSTKNEYYHLYHTLTGKHIQPGTDKNGAQLLKRLNGVIVLNHAATQNALQPVNIFGFGERYNQVLLNGATLNSFDPVNKIYPFQALPVEAISTVSLQTIADPSLQGNFAGGSIAITTKDMPDTNFFYILAGTGFSGSTNDKDFYRDKRGSLEILSYPGSNRDLPGDFPTTRSFSFFNELNPQEQVYVSKQLKNNLEPENSGKAKLNDRVMLGFGKLYKFKNKDRIGISVFINHQASERIDESVTQASPDLLNNLFPFANTTKPLIRSLSNDISYRYNSTLSGIANATIIFKSNKISLKSFYVSQFDNTFTHRMGIMKPDEDTLAHTGARYKTENRKLVNVQLSGEHALGKSQTFLIRWQAAYDFYWQQNPDERNILLKPDSAGHNTYELANASAASLSSPEGRFTNSGRLWRNYKDHHFTGAFNIGVPFLVADRKQYLSGGIYLETFSREYNSNLLLVKGTGYYPLNGLFDSERYYPGGLSVQNYYIRFDPRVTSGVVMPDNRGNYTASANLGASYIKLEGELARGLSLVGGVRVESMSQLVSISEYRYFEGFRNPRITPLDQNSRVNKFSILPAINLVYRPLKTVQLHAAWFKTVNRPQPEELSASRYYDASVFMVRSGNPILSVSTIDNFDGGIDLFAGKDVQVSVSGIYKKIDQPIEYIISPYANAQGNLLLMPHNMPHAEIYGIKASYRISLGFLAPSLSNISLFAGGSWLQTKVSEGPVKSGATPLVEEHTLSGSPDYTINAGLVIQYPELPMLAVLFNRTGDYIAAVGSGIKYTLGNGNSVLAVPDYRIKGRNQLDLQLSQKFFKQHAQLMVGVTNLLDDDYIGYQDLNGNKKFDNALFLTGNNGKTGFYQSGTDNTVLRIKQQPAYYVTLSYLFR